MSFYNLLKDSLEEFDQDEFTPEAGEAVVEEIINEEDSTVAIQNEVLEDGTMDADDVKIDLVEDEVEAMESIVTSLESLISQGEGLNPLSGALLNNHLNAISKRLGVRFITHSAESFENEVASLQAAQDSLESIKEKLQAAYEWIVEALRKLWASAKEWFKATFTLRGRYEAQAKKLLEVVKGLKSDDPRVTQSGKLKGEHSVKWLLGADEILYDAEDLGRVIKSSAILGNIINVSGLSKVRGQLIKVTEERNQEFSKALDEYFRLDLTSRKSLAGGRIVNDFDRNKNEWKKSEWREYKEPSNAELDALNQGEMTKLLEDILEGLKLAEAESKKVEKELEDTKDIDAIDKQVKEAEKKGKEGGLSAERIRASQRVYLNLKRHYMRNSRMVVRSNNQAIRAGLRWVAASLAHKEEA